VQVSADDEWIPVSFACHIQRHRRKTADISVGRILRETDNVVGFDGSNGTTKRVRRIQGRRKKRRTIDDRDAAVEKKRNREPNPGETSREIKNGTNTRMRAKYVGQTLSPAAFSVFDNLLFTSIRITGSIEKRRISGPAYAMGMGYVSVCLERWCIVGKRLNGSHCYLR